MLSKPIAIVKNGWAFTGFPLLGGDPYFRVHGCQPASPFVLSPDGTDLFYYSDQELAHSADSGLHRATPLQPLVPSGVYKWQDGALSISAVDPRRPLAHIRVGPPVDGVALLSIGFVIDTLPDPLARDVVYLGLGDPDPTPPIRWLRSEDGGRTWHRLRLPVSSGPDLGTDTSLTNFPGMPLSIDPHLPGAIVLRAVHVARVPPDQRWVSHDRGATWKQPLCPGDLHGTCPTYTLDNVFGAGKVYGFFADGVPAFVGAGPAGPRVALSDQLPCRGADVLDVGGGAHAGDPVYLLCQARQLPIGLSVYSGTTQVGALYRSAGAGASWHRLDPASGW